MKNRLLIFFAVSLILISGFCLALFFKNKNTQTITICNSISGKEKKIEAITGAEYSKYLNPTTLEGYDFEGYYYDRELTKKVDTEKQIIESHVVYEGYIQKISSGEDINSKAIGVSFVGSINSADIYSLLNYKKVFIQTDSNIDFAEQNNLIEELTIIGANKVSNFASSKLETISIKNVAEINNCFNGCANLKTISSLECQTITNSFCNCLALKNLIISSTIENIEQSFYKTPLETIAGENQKYVVENGILYEKNNEDYVLVKATANISSFTSNTTTSEISSFAFFGCQNLTSAELNGRISKIGAHAFEGTSLASVDLSHNYTILTIEDSAFATTSNLQSVNFGNLVYKIEDKAFWQSGLKSADLSGCEFLTQIGKYAFAHSKQLTQIKFSGSENIISAKEGAFTGCQNLAKVENINFAQIENMLFYECEKLTTLSGNQITGKIGNLSFYGCKSLAQLQILSSAESIGTSAFENCTSLTNIQFNNITNVKEKAFSNATQLLTIGLGNIIESIDFSAFDNCENISQINFSSANYTLQNNAIYSSNMQSILYYLPNSAQTTFNIASSVNSIETKYLSRAKNLTSVSSSSSSYVCEDGVLYDIKQGKKLVCYPMAKTNEQFVVPGSVTEITAEAFVNCPNLATITIPANVTTINNNALSKMQALATVEMAFVGETANSTQTAFLGWIFGAKQYGENNKYVPQSLKNVTITANSKYKATFYGCESVENITITSINNISSYMFTGCTSLQKLTLNSAIQSIGAYALYSCKNIVEIRLGYYEDIEIDKTGLSNMATSLKIYVSGITDIALQLTPYKEKFAKNTWTWRTV